MKTGDKLWTLDELRDGWRVLNTETGELFDSGRIYKLLALAAVLVDVLNDGDLRPSPDIPEPNNQESYPN